MRESKTLATRFLYGVLLTCVVLLGVLAVFTVRPHEAAAAGSAADAMCTPVMPVCGCHMMMKGNPPTCQPDANMFMCPCMDTTNGFTTPGICISSFKCQAQGQAGQPPMPPMPPMPPPPPPPSDSPPPSPCDTASSPIFNGQNGTISTSTNAGGDSGACPGSSGSNPTSSLIDTSGLFNGIGSTTSVTDNSDISSLFDGTINSNSNTPGNPTQASVSGVPQTSTPSAPKPPFGSAEGISGDVQMQGTSVTILASNRDSSRGTQVSGFYGITAPPGASAANVVKDMCATRPWASSFLSFILPSSFFDGLCTERGFTVGPPPAPVSSASSATSAAAPAVPPPAPAPPPPPAYLGALRADIWASPPAVALGSRTSIFWDSAGTLSCSLWSSDNAFTENTVSGHATSQVLKQNTTFSIMCQSATSSVSNQVVVTIQ